MPHCCGFPGFNCLRSAGLRGTLLFPVLSFVLTLAFASLPALPLGREQVFRCCSTSGPFLDNNFRLFVFSSRFSLGFMESRNEC